MLRFRTFAPLGLALALLVGGTVVAQSPPAPKPPGAPPAPQAPQAAKPKKPESKKPAGNPPPEVEEENLSIAETLKKQGFNPQAGPCQGELGALAAIAVPAGMTFVRQGDMSKFATLTHNPPDPKSVGAILPEDGSWILWFSYDDVGHVNDDEKGKLDADAILTSIREGTEESNTYRKQQGWDALHVVGWDQPPFYDEQTKNLTWAMRVRGGNGDSVNYNSRILGRTGVMSVNLIVDPEKLAQTLPVQRDLLAKFAYKPNQGYSEFRAGDKIAAYGLTALVAGGAAAVAAQTGLLAKFGKVIIVAGLAVFGAIAKFFKGIMNFFTGNKQADA